MLSSLAEELPKRFNQSRNKVNYTNYEPSLCFLERKKAWPPKIKELTRETWWSHKDYHRYPQMPEFHVHFRVETASMMKAIYEAYDFHQKGNRLKRERKMNLAKNTFESSMSTLSFHVAIEERRVFPEMQRKVGNEIDMSFLYEDHESLHKAEEQLKMSLELACVECVKGVGKDAENDDEVESALSQVVSDALAFDTVFMNHLGEEEELVVPITLVYGVNF